MKDIGQCFILGFILDLYGFKGSMLKWCSLHTLNLGPMVWSCAGAIEMLLAKERVHPTNMIQP